jgi:hypothetical protein
MQLWCVFWRVVLEEVRNPFNVILKVIMGVFFGLVTFLVYSEVNSSIQSVRDRQGYFFFLAVNLGFNGIQSTLPVLIP